MDGVTEGSHPASQLSKSPIFLALSYRKIQVNEIPVNLFQKKLYFTFETSFLSFWKGIPDLQRCVALLPPVNLDACQNLRHHRIQICSYNFSSLGLSASKWSGDRGLKDFRFRACRAISARNLHDMSSTMLSAVEMFGAHGLDGVSSLHLIVRTGGRFKEVRNLSLGSCSVYSNRKQGTIAVFP